mgnify:CR=1 FL=1
MKKIIIQFTCNVLCGRYVDLMEFPFTDLASARHYFDEFKKEFPTENQIKMIFIETIISDKVVFR